MSAAAPDVAVVGKTDYLALVVGPPGMGKSSLAAELVAQRLAEHRWVLVQDSNREFGKLCVEYPDPAAFLETLARANREEKPMPQGAAFPIGGDAVLELAQRLGDEWNRQRGRVSEPICVAINEASTFEESGSTFMGRLQNAVINQRRHLGLELIYCMQRPAQLMAAFWENATDVYMFQQQRDDVIDKLEQNLGLRKGSLRALQVLPPHRYLHWRRMAGLL